MHVNVGDKLYAITHARRWISAISFNPDFEKAMEVARRGMKRYHNALAELAK